MKPFLLLSSRAEDLAADGEYAAFLRCTGLSPEQLHRFRLEALEERFQIEAMNSPGGVTHVTLSRR